MDPNHRSLRNVKKGPFYAYAPESPVNPEKEHQHHTSRDTHSLFLILIAGCDRKDF
jgi:hypothetical protein